MFQDISCFKIKDMYFLTGLQVSRVFFYQKLACYLRSVRNGNLVIFCVGNELRGDDRVGLEIFRRLKGNIRKPIQIYYAGSSLENFSSLITREHFTYCLIIDAVHFSENSVHPGTIGFFDPNDLDNSQVTFSTHHVPLNIFIDYIKGNSKIRILGIQPKVLSYGAEISTPVLKAVEELSSFLLSQLQETKSKGLMK